jgi:ATP synthase protein I
MPNDPYGGSSEPSDDDERRAERQAANDAWSAFGLMLSGVVVWGGAGYLVARWTGHQLFTMLGLLLGMGTALYGVWFRYGRS